MGLASRAEFGVNYIRNRVSGDYSDSKIELSWDDKPKRFDLINRAIAEMGYKDYLEIGCQSDVCFDHVNVENSTGVDPASGGTHRMTSDAFFEENQGNFDIIFIDGLHVYDQVLRDIENSVENLKDGGTIFLHDCLPLQHKAHAPLRETRVWNGDVWRAIVQARTWDHIDTSVCLIDHGVGIIRKRPNSNKLDLQTEDFGQLKYSDLAANYENWLNTIEFEDAMSFIKGQ